MPLDHPRPTQNIKFELSTFPSRPMESDENKDYMESNEQYASKRNKKKSKLASALKRLNII